MSSQGVHHDQKMKISPPISHTSLHLIKYYLLIELSIIILFIIYC